ncbi:MAG: bile acid:sodium symporter [Bacteroidetes bacterium]|nr:MAG: bile acid:sodium symporter [Bacteroidota bacterium]
MKDIQTIQLALSIAVAIIMLGMGLSLTINDFLRIKKQPKAVLIGLVNQLVLLPFIGYTLAVLLGLQAEIAVGLMLIAACPGGPVSNLYCNLARGDLALSITLTALTSLITVFTIPIVVNQALLLFMETEHVVQIDFWQTVFKILMVTIVPVSVGMVVYHYFPAVATKMEKPVKIVSSILLGVIITGAFIANKDELLDALPFVGTATLALNVITMAIGFFSGRLFKLNYKERVSISVECGIQNGALALFIGSLGVMANYPGVLLAPAVYGILMFFTGAIFAAVVNFFRPKDIGA